MNTRILRMIDRRPIETPNGPWKHPVWLIQGMGQLQPVTIGNEGERGITLRIEGVADYHGDVRSCWRVLPLSTSKAQAKQALAELERCNALGIDSPARASWREYEHQRALKSKSKVVAPTLIPSLGLFADYSKEVA